MKWFLLILTLLIVIQNGESARIIFSSLLKDFKQCVENAFSIKINHFPVVRKNPQLTFNYGIQVAQGDLVEEDSKVLSQEILLNYPDQEEMNDGPTPLQVEMVDEVYFRKSNTSREIDELQFGDGRVRPNVPEDKIKKVKEMKDEKTTSKRTYTLAPYSRAYIRSMIVRQKVAYTWMRPTYVYGSIPMIVTSFRDLKDNPKWQLCGTGQKPSEFLEGKNIVDVPNMITDPDIQTDDGELVFYLRDRMIVEEEKVVLLINAQEMTDKKDFAYQKLCRA